MTKRKSLSKKIRFEVFKRDSFTCQYCGSKVPDVILEVDHIKPVSKGGKNELINLVTSCFSCNRGKGKRELKDNSVVELQRQQILELNLRRQQLEMMLDLRNSLNNQKEVEGKNAVDYFNKNFTTMMLSDSGESHLKKLVKQFNLPDVLDGIDIAFDKYYKGDKSISEVLDKVGGIVFLNRQPEHRRKISYIKGIVKNKFYYDAKQASIFLSYFHKEGGDLDDVIEKLKSGHIDSWNDFINYIDL